MADQNSKLIEKIVYYEDWTGGESVTIINTVLPDDVTNLAVANVQSTSITLSWTSSTSADVTGYEIYNGTTYLGTTEYTTYVVEGLTPVTSYSFVVKSRNSDGLTASGVSINAATSQRTYALAMNGKSDYIITPVIQFDEVTIDFSAKQKNGAFGAYLDASRGITQSIFGRDSKGIDFLQSAWKSIYIDGVDQTSLIGSSAVVPTNQRVTVNLVLKSAGKTALVIFANQLGQIPMEGILYSIKILLGGKMVAYYDLSVQNSGTSIPDKTDNSKAATLNGGTWLVL